MVIDDCSLETGFRRDEKIPLMKYQLKIVNTLPGTNNDNNNKETHLSADEFGLTIVRFMTLTLSFLVALYLIVHIGYHHLSKKKKQQHSIHVAVLWVLVAAGLDILSSLLEIIHLRIYDINGIGSYIIDALAAHCEALCDAALVIFLLLIGAGWTLPSDVISVNHNESVIQKMISDLIRPTFTNAVVPCTILAFHVILAQWGRTYDDDFDSYHALEHLPGRILMMFRILCTLLLIVATVQTRNKCTIQHLKSFYTMVATLGTMWLLSLPFLSWFCSWFIPYYLRHPAVFCGAAMIQSSSLVLFAWLVTSHSTTYHQFSHMASSDTSKMSFTEALHTSSVASASLSTTTKATGGSTNGSEPRTWKFGKTKVRLD